jgi:sortase A
MSSNSRQNDDDQPLSVPSRDHQFATPDRQVAASYIRDQIDSIYDDNPPNQTAEQREAAQANAQNNPYMRTHDPAAAAHMEPQQHAANQWQRYHQAWQQYYQQYYQRYYTHHLIREKQKLTAGAATVKNIVQTAPEEPVPEAEAIFSEDPTVSKQDAAQELKDELIGKVKLSAGRARRSAHFMPIISAIVVGLLFLLLQYNRVFIAQVKAYISPGSASPQSIILDPTTDIRVSNEPRIIIPKLNVDAPVVYDVGSVAEAAIQRALEDGVVHYPIPGANSVPGQVGNTVMVGHSSNDVFDSGDYKFVFVLLDRLQKGDVFYLHHKGTRYTYSVTEKKVINPNQISTLQLDTDKPMATLLTCTPPGTSLKRLLVFAEQISPDPAAATAAPASGATEDPMELPSNSPSLLNRLFNRD